MSRRTSDDVAPASATMKFACAVDTDAPPQRVPLSPAWSIKAPAGLSLYKPAYLKEMKALACKVVSIY